MSQYSKSELLAQIRMLATDGKPPTQIEYELHDNTASVSPINNHFGSWNNAVRAAGYNPNTNKKYTDQELIQQLRKIKSPNVAPSYGDVQADNTIASISTFLSRFGSYEAALKEAGYTNHEVDNPAEKKTQYEIIKQLIALNEKIDGEVETDDLEKHDNAPSPVAIAQHFVDLDHAKKKAQI
jgi:hypothetical protein